MVVRSATPFGEKHYDRAAIYRYFYSRVTAACSRWNVCQCRKKTTGSFSGSFPSLAVAGVLFTANDSNDRAPYYLFFFFTNAKFVFSDTNEYRRDNCRRGRRHDGNVYETSAYRRAMSETE